MRPSVLERNRIEGVDFAFKCAPERELDIWIVKDLPRLCPFIGGSSRPRHFLSVLHSSDRISCHSRHLPCW